MYQDINIDAMASSQGGGLSPGGTTGLGANLDPVFVLSLDSGSLLNTMSHSDTGSGTRPDTGPDTGPDTRPDTGPDTGPGSVTVVNPSKAASFRCLQRASPPLDIDS